MTRHLRTAGRVYATTIHWLLRSRYGQRVGGVVVLAIFRGVAYIERHDTNPITDTPSRPMGDGQARTTRPYRSQDIDE